MTFEVGKCKNCGDEFTYERTHGRRRHFCSEKCKTHWNNAKYHKDYWKNRWHNDEAWREKRRAYNNAYNKKRYSDNTITAWEALADELLNAESREEFMEILKTRTSMKRSTVEHYTKEDKE